MRKGMKNSLRVAIAMVLMHLVVNVVHGAAHHSLAIGLTGAESLFVELDILAAPLVATGLLLTKWRRGGALLLAVSMAAALVFGVYKHFITGGPDNALTVAPGAWGTAFQITAALLAITEALACWAGIAAAKQSGSEA